MTVSLSSTQLLVDDRSRADRRWRRTRGRPTGSGEGKEGDGAEQASKPKAKDEVGGLRGTGGMMTGSFQKYPSRSLRRVRSTHR
jgi:hypothetical protein